MNSSTDQNTKEINIMEIILFYFKNLKALILVTLIPFSIGVGLLLYLKPLVEINAKNYSANILIQDETIISSISKEYFFSNNNIKEALIRSDLIEKVDVPNTSLVKSFSIISGHSDLNALIDDYISRDFSSLTKSLYFEPDKIDSFLKEIINDGARFRILVFNKGNNNLTDPEISILISHLVDVINENLQFDFDSSNIGLKKIKLLEFSNPISSIDVNNMNNRLNLVREYINILISDYASFAPDINLQIDLNKLDSNEELFNYVIQENDLYRTIIQKKLELDLESTSEKVNVVLNKIDLIGIDNERINDQPDTANFSADSTFIDKILILGDKANSKDARLKYLDDITELENTRITIERRLRDLELKPDYKIPVSEAQSYLIESINNTTNRINSYIDVVKNTKKEKEAIVLLSMATQMDEPYAKNLWSRIQYLIIGSILIGFAFITYLFFKRGY